MKELFKGGGWLITEETAPLPDGRTAKRTRASFADIVHILAFDESGTLITLREFRPFYQQCVCAAAVCTKDLNPRPCHIKTTVLRLGSSLELQVGDRIPAPRSGKIQASHNELSEKKHWA